MLRKSSNKQISLEFVSIEDLVPKNHLLRKIDHIIDFEFIREKVKGLYCADNGRPAVDPVVLFKMLFIGYLQGIRSERQLVRDIQVNVAYRWFIGFGLTDKIPDASTFSQNRRRRFTESTVYQDIFDEIVMQAMRKKLVNGRVLYTDSTHLKASANKHRFEKIEVESSTRGYLDELEAAINADRKAHGKKPMAKKIKEPASREIKSSTTDPDSGYMVREGKPKGFFYLDHRTTCGKHNLITDTYVTSGNVHDSIPYLERLDRQRQRFGFSTAAVGLDAGYMNAPICKGLEDREIYGVIGYRRPNHIKGRLYKRDYIYDVEADVYRCPNGKVLTYRTTNRNGYREYRSNPEQCRDCPLRGQCTSNAQCVKTVTRHVWEDHKETVDLRRTTRKGKAIYKRRKETVERSFADAKQLHGHRYMRMRGMLRAQEQCLLAAACQNMKKMALLLCKPEKQDDFDAKNSFCMRLLRLICDMTLASGQLRRQLA
ncbi:IS1182 family transposase [Mariprofundus sp. NF]|uniref:IS1182 family transposase n=1 Tax=Mariprofundus sp. NF TaxID=2608716 RepID=UPI001F508201|nr:IS1182 family transposase [Mariprofundus sp. NF]